MKSFKSYITEAPTVQKPIPVAYGSISNRPDVYIPHVKTATSIPAVFGSIGDRLDPMSPMHPAHQARMLQQQVVKMLSGRYKHGFNTLPHRHQVSEYYEHGIPLSKVQAGEKPQDPDIHYGYGSKESDELDKNIHELEEYHGHKNYEVCMKKKHDPAIFHYVGGSSDLNGALIHAHSAGLEPTKREHLAKSLAAHYTHFYGNDSEASEHEVDKLHSVIHGLDHIIHESKPMHKDMHVYTGIGSKLNIHELRQAGHDKVHLPAFTSTSVKPTVASGFSHRGSKPHHEMIRIHLPQGSKHGVWLGSTGLTGEHEFLMKRGVTLKFHGEPHVVKQYDNHMLIHDATIEDHHEEQPK